MKIRPYPHRRSRVSGWILYDKTCLRCLTIRQLARRALSKRFGIYVHGHSSNFIPRMLFCREISYLLSPATQISEKIAREVTGNRRRQVRRILGPEYEPRFAFDNVLFEGAHVGYENGEAETVSKEQDAALVDMPVRQHQNIGRFEINFCLIIWNKVCP